MNPSDSSQWLVWLLILWLIVSRIPGPVPAPCPKSILDTLGVNRIAVIRFKYIGDPRKKDITEEEATSIIEEFFVRGGGKVFSRNELEKILKEQKLEYQLSFDSPTVAKIGKLCGVDAIVIGNFTYSDSDSKLLAKYLVRVKVIKVDTGQIIFSAGATSFAGTKDALHKVEQNFIDTFSY